MNIHELDLNLLRVFQAIYLERSISKATKHLDVTQPAVSKSLKRLRDFTCDRLFYTSGKGVAPTRGAMALAVPIHHALETVEQNLASLRGFDPATSDRRFRIGVNDVVNPVLVPALVGIVRKSAQVLCWSLFNKKRKAHAISSCRVTWTQPSCSGRGLEMVCIQHMSGSKIL